MKNTHPKLYKFLRWSVLVMVSLLVVFIIASFYIAKNEKNLILGLEQIKYDMYMKPFLDEQAKLEAARKIDNIGGQTPEETLDMYIEALKKGDLEQAVKLYEVEKQEEKRIWVKTLNVDDAIKNLEYLKSVGKGEIAENREGYYSIGYIETASADISTTTVTFDGSIVPLIIKKGATSTVEMILVKNQYTGVWKIVF